MSSEKVATLDVPQLGVRFLVDSNTGMWMERQTSELWVDAQKYWSSWLLTMLLHNLAYCFRLGY